MTPEAIMTPGGIANGMGDIVQALAQLPVQLKQARLREATAQREEQHWQAEFDMRKQDAEMRRQDAGIDRVYRQNTDRRAEEELKLRQQDGVRQVRNDEIRAAMDGYAPKSDVTGTRGLFESYVNPYMQGKMPTGPAQEYADPVLGAFADRANAKFDADMELNRLGKETYAKSINLQNAQADERTDLAKRSKIQGPILDEITSINKKLDRIERERSDRYANSLTGRNVYVGDLDATRTTLENNLAVAEKRNRELMAGIDLVAPPGSADGHGNPDLVRLREVKTWPTPFEVTDAYGNPDPAGAAASPLAPARSSSAAAIMERIKARSAAGKP